MLFIGAVGVIAIGVQSAMYGSLERAGQIDVTQIGIAASAEMVALALGVVLAGKLAQYLKLMPLAGVAAMGLMCANLAMTRDFDVSLVGLRVVAGISGGIMLWLANAYIVLGRRVVQLAAVFLILQTAVQFSVAAGAAGFAPHNPDIIPLIMAGCGVIALVLSPAARGWSVMPEDHEPSQVPRFNARGVTALGVMVLLQASLVGGWILVELVGVDANLPEATVALATPTMLAAQVFGGLAAMVLSNRLSWNAALMVVGVLLAAVQVAIGQTTTAILFLTASFIYGLLWNFSLPQLTAMGLAADPSMRIARIGPAAVVLGAALGPLASASLAEQSSAATATMAFLLPSLLISVAAAYLQHRIARHSIGENDNRIV